MWARPATFLLDSNAGAPLRPEAVEAILPLLRSPEGGSASGDGGLPHIPNPSSTHARGRQARNLLSHARERVARSLGASSSEQIVFTSSGTEANQQAIRTILEPLLVMGKRPHWILTSVEHDCVSSMVPWLEARGGSVSFLRVDANGALKIEELAGLFRPETALVSALWVNNETGVIHGIGPVLSQARARGIPVHLDGAQAWGKIPFAMEALEGVSFAAFSGHKIGGLPGTGVLWARDWRDLAPIMPGKQERGLRGGTENVLGIVAAGAAAQAIDTGKLHDAVAESRDALEREVLRALPLARINGGASPRSGNTLNVCLGAYQARDLVMALDLEGYAVSTGSACSAGSPAPSPVLLAMGLSREDALASIRISLAEPLAFEVVQRFVQTLSKIVHRQQRSA